MKERIEQIENSVAILAGKLGQVVQMVDRLSTEEREPHKMVDDLWKCRSCGARLGVYNVKRNELRVRYKDFSVYIVSGEGGRVSVPCRRCAEINIAEDKLFDMKSQGL